MNNKRIFIDIEKTLIEALDDVRFINHDFISNIVKDEPVSLFTFGIWNNDELNHSQWIINQIAEIHQLNISNVFVKEDILKCVNLDKSLNIPFNIDEDDLRVWFGKAGAFISFCKVNCIGECILIDDMVENCTIDFPDRNLKITMIKCS